MDYQLTTPIPGILHACKSIPCIFCVDVRFAVGLSHGLCRFVLLRVLRMWRRTETVTAVQCRSSAIRREISKPHVNIYLALQKYACSNYLNLV
jgi:hypothetical protein